MDCLILAAKENNVNVANNIFNQNYYQNIFVSFFKGSKHIDWSILALTAAEHGSFDFIKWVFSADSKSSRLTQLSNRTLLQILKIAIVNNDNNLISHLYSCDQPLIRTIIDHHRGIDTSNDTHNFLALEALGYTVYPHEYALGFLGSFDVKEFSNLDNIKKCHIILGIMEFGNLSLLDDLLNDSLINIIKTIIHQYFYNRTVAEISERFMIWCINNDIEIYGWIINKCIKAGMCDVLLLAYDKDIVLRDPNHFTIIEESKKSCIYKKYYL
jgi:hypothetical protein